FQVRGNFKYAYQLLISYFAKVRLVNPDLVFDIQTTTCKDKRFTRYFWCFDAPKKTYKLLRPVIVNDNFFLKGRYRGTLLTAIVIDPSYHIFLLAFSVIDSETIKNWPYFLEMFGSNFNNFDTRFIVISNRALKLLILYLRCFHLLSIHFETSTYRTTLKLPSKVRGSYLRWQQRL
ncbi:hypothetical protein GIB67_014685, partial [Kingdonia uniflora]